MVAIKFMSAGSQDWWCWFIPFSQKWWTFQLKHLDAIIMHIISVLLLSSQNHSHPVSFDDCQTRFTHAGRLSIRDYKRPLQKSGSLLSLNDKCPAYCMRPRWGQLGVNNSGWVGLPDSYKFPMRAFIQQHVKMQLKVLCLITPTSSHDRLG